MGSPEYSSISPSAESLAAESLSAEPLTAEVLLAEGLVAQADSDKTNTSEATDTSERIDKNCPLSDDQITDKTSIHET